MSLKLEIISLEKTTETKMLIVTAIIYFLLE